MIRARLHGLADLLAALCCGLASALVLGVTALLLADVVGRAFGVPLFGAQDLAEMAMVLMTFGALALLEQRDAQIRVELFKPLMPQWLIACGDMLAAILGSALWFALAYAIWESAALSSLLNLASNILKLPKAPVQYAVAALIAIAGAINLLRAFAPARKAMP